MSFNPVNVQSLTDVQEGYKGQGGWDTVLGRFPRGKGTLLDLEFLEDGTLTILLHARL